MNKLIDKFVVYIKIKNVCDFELKNNKIIILFEIGPCPKPKFLIPNPKNQTINY